MLSCLVDKDGAVHTVYWPGACLVYDFDLEKKEMVRNPIAQMPFLVEARHDEAARRYFEEQAGTPEKLMRGAVQGKFSKEILAALLVPEKRRAYFDGCELVRKALIESCEQERKFVKEEYAKFCGFQWVYIFLNPENRIDNWKS